MNLPILYHKGKNGELRQWRVWSEDSNILTEYGVVNGALQTSRKTAEAKNVGRSNETTPEQQAASEAQSLWTFKVERKYAETPEAAQQQLPLPMLAHSYFSTSGVITSKGKKFPWPGWVQPKLDGVRCLAERVDGVVRLTSRQGKPWNVPLIQKELQSWLPEGAGLDGEIYVHGESCQRITSLVKSADPSKTKRFKEESQLLKYWVYDIPTSNGDDTLTWEKRRRILNATVGVEGSDGNVLRVKSFLVNNEKEMMERFEQILGLGYEGAILRGMDGKYLWGYRSAELLKVKKFQDAEFEVIGFRDGKGKDEGCAIFTCQNDETDGTFETRMKGTLADRQRFFREGESYVGRKLTVRFFDRTDAKIPRFPVGKVFRAPEDLPS